LCEAFIFCGQRVFQAFELPGGFGQTLVDFNDLRIDFLQDDQLSDLIDVKAQRCILLMYPGFPQNRKKKWGIQSVGVSLLGDWAEVILYRYRFGFKLFQRIRGSCPG
jgi:hypothetical protein